MRRSMALLAVMALGLAGCASSNVVPVSGTVTLDDGALEGAVVTFRPADKQTEGLGGSGTTDGKGKYVVTAARGEKGLAPGKYVVTVSWRRRPDGSAPDPNVPPIESDAVEKLPPRYSDQSQTILEATVAKDRAAHDFPLSTKKK